MVPSGSSNPVGSAHSISPVLLRSKSAILESQGDPMPPQATYSSLVSSRAQYNMNLLGTTANISSLLNHTFGSGGANSSLSGLVGSQRGSFDTIAESDPLSIFTNDVAFSATLSSFASPNITNSVTSGQARKQQISNSSGNPVFSDQQQSQVQQFEPQKFQYDQHPVQQFPASQSQQLQHHQPRFQSIQGGIGVAGPVKLEPHMINDTIGLHQPLQPLRNLGTGKLELQQNQIGRGIGPIKLERQHSDQAMLLHQQQFLHLSKQSSQAALAQMNLLQQQSILQLPQQHQQQLLKAFPQQRPQLPQEFEQQNLPIRSAGRAVYEPGMCARRLTQFMYQHQHRPDDNNIEFWRKFVAEFFAPNAKKRWCVSLYGNSHQTDGVFPQDLWHCEICNHKPGRGFETIVEVLPRLFKVKYDSGTLEELLYVDMPREYQNSNGQIVLDYAKAIQESVFEHLRVVRDGQLRIVFSPDLKICSWEFCAHRHEELIPRRLIIPQVSQLGAAAQKYQASAQNASSNLSAPDFQSNYNTFVSSARQLAKALDVPLVNDLGYTKRYVRCLQIAEVVDSMKDLIDCSRETGLGPMESLAKFPRRSSTLSKLHDSAQQPAEQQQVTGETISNDHHSVQVNVVQHNASSGVANVSNSRGTMSTSASATTIVELLHQNSMNSRIENQINNPSSPYSGTPIQISSAGSSTTLPTSQPNPSSPFSSPTPSSRNNPPQTSHNTLAASTSANHISSANSPAQIQLQRSSQSNVVDPNESQSSVEKIIQEIMISSQLSEAGCLVSVGSVGNNMKNMNGLTELSQNSLTSGNCLVGNGIANNNLATGGGGFGNMGGGISLSNARDIRTAMGNNSLSMTGRVGMPMLPQGAGMNHQQQEMTKLLNGFGAANGFNNFQFDWKCP